MKIFIVLLSLTLISCTQADSKVSEKKHKFLHNHPKKQKKLGKLRAYMQMQIEDVSRNDATLDLKATIIGQDQMSNAQLEWRWPKHVEMVSGQKNQTVNIQSGQTQEIDVSFDKNSLKANDQIFLFVYQMKNGERHGGTSSFVYKITEVVDEESDQKQLKLKESPKLIE